MVTFVKHRIYTRSVNKSKKKLKYKKNGLSLIKTLSGKTLSNQILNIGFNENEFPSLLFVASLIW